MICKKCEHEIEEIETPDFNGELRLILVHKKQSTEVLYCEEQCECGCSNPEPKEAKKNNG